MRSFVKVEEENGNPVVKLFTGSFVWPTVEVIGDELFSLAEESGWKNLHLDFGAVEFLTAAALGKLVALHKKLIKAGRQLILYDVCPDIYEVFEVTQLVRIFEIRKTTWQTS